MPSATVAQAFEYLVHGGLANLEHLLRFVVRHRVHDRLRLRSPRRGARHRRLLPQRPATAPEPPARRVAVLFYRAHLVAGNTGFVDDLCDALEDRGARVTAVWCYTLRPDADGRVEALDLLRRRPSPTP